MAKKVSTDFEIRATKAVQELERIAKAVGNYTERVNQAATKNSAMAKANERLTKSLENLIQPVADAGSKFKSLNGRLETAKERVSAFSAAAGGAAARMGTLSKHTGEAHVNMRNFAKHVGAANTHLPEIVAHLESMEKGMRHSSTGMLRAGSRALTFAGQIRAATQQLRILQIEASKATTQWKEMAGGISRILHPMDEANKHASHFGLSMRQIARVSGVIALYKAWFILAQNIRNSAAEAVEYSKRISEIQTLSQKFAVSNHELAISLDLVSTTFGTGVLETAEGAYQAISNQTVNVTEASKFMVQEVKLATVAVSDLATAVSATTGVLNAYQLSADKASYVNAILFKTVELGRLRLENIADELGRVSILSDTLGVSLEEQQASIAVLTRQGLTAAEAMTLLRNVELRLIKPTERMQEIFDDWGVTSGQAAVETFGFFKILQMFADEAQRSGDVADEMGEIFGRLRAILGALGLTNLMGQMETALKDFSTAGIDYANAFEIRMDALDKRFSVQSARLAEYFRTNISEPVIELTIDLLEKFGGLDKVADALYRIITELAIAYGTYRVSVTLAGYATGALLKTKTALIAAETAEEVAIRKTMAARAAAASRANAYALAITAAIVVTYEWWQSTERAMRSAENAGKSMERELTLRMSGALDQVSARLDIFAGQSTQALNESLRGLREYIAATRSYLNDLDTRYEASFRSISKVTKDAAKGASDIAKGILADIESSRKKVESSLESRKSHVTELMWDLSADKFRDKIKGLSEPAQVNVLRKARDEMVKRAFASSDSQEFDFIIERVNKLTDELKNRATEVQQEAGRMQKVMETVEVPEYDVYGRVKIKKKRELIDQTSDVINPKTGKALTFAELEKKASEELESLEKSRLDIAERRLQKQREFVKLEEDQIAAAKKREKEQAAAIETLTELLARIDTFDIKKDGAEKEYASLIGQTQAAATAAGVTPKEQLDLLRAAHAQRLALEIKAEKDIQLERLKSAQDRTSQIADLLQKEKENAEALRKKAVTDYAALVQNAAVNAAAVKEFLRDLTGKTDANLQADAQFPRPDVSEVTRVNNLIRSTERLADAMSRFPKDFEITGAADPERLAIVTGMMEQLKKKMMEVNELSKTGKLERKARIFGIGGIVSEVAPRQKQPRDEFRDLLIPRVVKGQVDGRGSVIFLLQEEMKQAKAVKAVMDELEQSETNQEAVNVKVDELRRYLDSLPPKYKEWIEASKEALNLNVNDTQVLHKELQRILTDLRQVRDASGALDFKQQQLEGIAPVPLRNQGGLVDRHVAMLQGGEFIVPKYVTQMHLPFLTALVNSTPSHKGEATNGNVTFGDIHITAGQGTPDAQLLQIAAGLKRLTRQGLF